MSKKPTLEDIDDDIDNMDMDIAEFDPSLRTPIAPLRPEPTVTRSQDSGPGFGFPNIPMPPVSSQGGRNPEVVNPNSFTQAERELLQKFQIIYPCYFDVQRSHKQGRRVSEKNAVFNPLAKTISDACRQLRLPVLLELEKTHPQDFGNPGRVRVLIKDASDGNKVVDSRFQNKRVLLNTIAKYLKEHPTTLESVSTKSSVALPPDYEGFEPEEIPQVKGYKMNTLVPVHSKYNLKHPMTRSIYDPEPEESHKPIAPKVPKKKVMKIRG